MKLHDFFTDWLSALRHEQGVSLNTIETYRPRLRAFLEWLQAETKQEPVPADFTKPNCRKYVYHLCNKQNRPRTVRGVFDAIRSFARFLCDAGILTDDPTKGITLPKLDAAVRLEVASEDVAALFDAAGKQKTLRQCAIARAVLSILIYGGLRRNELCDLLIDDVDLSAQSVLVRSGKGAKSRKVYLCKDGVEAVREWLSVRGQSQSPALFIVDKRRRLHHKGVAALLETLKATAGLRGDEAIKPHGLRHWSATNLLRNGATLRDVQAHLGHSNIGQTSRYLHADEERLRTIAELTALPRQQAQTMPNDKPSQLTQAQGRNAAPITLRAQKPVRRRITL